MNFLINSLVFIVVLYFDVSKQGDIDGNEKRLLLDDPDVSANRLLNLEKSVQMLKSTVTTLTHVASSLNTSFQVVTTTNTQSEGEIQALKSDLVAEKSEMQALKSELAAEKSEMQALKSELAAEKSEMQSLKSDLAAEKSRNVQLQATMSQTVTKIQNIGSNYVRWGRSKCTGPNTELVYSGYAAGQEWRRSTYFGGPANLLCLPDDPELSNHTVPGSAFIYGSEYEENTFATHSQQEDVPCAVCRSTNTVSSLMIPGRKTCYNGWKKEYQGILASNCYSCKASTYICVDSKPEYIAGGERDNNNNLLYAVGTVCGSLPCPPYHNNLVTNCVVCSK